MLIEETQNIDRSIIYRNEMIKNFIKIPNFWPKKKGLKGYDWVTKITVLLWLL